MALDKSDLELLGRFIDQKLHDAFQHGPEPADTTPEARAAKVGVPEVPFDAGPLYYLHLANGDVVTSHDSSSTHLAAADGSTQQIIGRFAVPPDALNDDGTLKAPAALSAGSEEAGQ